MCRTLHAVLQTLICGIQMLVRVFMTVILMIENLIRMILQTLYNFISFILQMLSLIPICVVFLLTARLKCFMCGGGGPCPVNRGGACDCIMSALAIVILFFIFRATGILDKLFFTIGYTKAKIPVYRFVPTPGDVTECSRNDTEYEYEEVIISTPLNDTEDLMMLHTTIALMEATTFIAPLLHNIENTIVPDKYVQFISTTETQSQINNNQSSNQNKSQFQTGDETFTQNNHNWTTRLEYTLTVTSTTATT